jgi:nucleoid DNA-binding protein
MARLTTKQLADALVNNGSFPTRAAARYALDEVNQAIIETLENGSAVSIVGFGRFEPFTLHSGKIKAKFTAFKAFKDAIN